MGFTREARDGRVQLKVEGQMTVMVALELRDQLAECFESYEGVILDLEGAESCDMAGVQLLCSARRTAFETGKEFSVTGASSAVMESVSLAGLDLKEILNVREEK